MDRLEEMIRRQRELQVRLGYDFEKMNPWQRVAYIKEMFIAAVKELGEALDETTWKPWSSADVSVNTDAFVSELNDAWQFICNMWLAALPDADAVDVALVMSSVHERKIRVNHKRVDDNYDNTSKCPVCRRALDDQHVRCDGTPSGCDTVMQTHPHSS